MLLHTAACGEVADSQPAADAASDASCVAETDQEYCLRLGKDCGSVTETDNCGSSRTASCGMCTDPETCGADNVCACPSGDPCGESCDVMVTDGCGQQISCSCTDPDVCGGGGTANVCAAHPPLTLVRGYILDLEDGRKRVNFAEDGVPTAGGACCFATVDDARAAYPDRSQAYLPGQMMLTEGVTPELSGVDGYIAQPNDGQFRVDFATDGAISGGAFCCATSEQGARDAYPDRNLVFLP